MPASGSCSVCAHPDLELIRESIASGLSARGTAEMYDVSSSTLNRHLRNCLHTDPGEETTHDLRLVGHSGESDAHQGTLVIGTEHAARLAVLNGRAQRMSRSEHAVPILRELMQLLHDSLAKQ